MSTLAPHRRVPKPVLIGHIVSRQHDIAAVRALSKIRVYGPLTLWIAEDGCIMAEHDNPRSKPPQDSVIGRYNEKASVSDITDDIGSSAMEFGKAKMSARA